MEIDELADNSYIDFFLIDINFTDSFFLNAQFDTSNYEFNLNIIGSDEAEYQNSINLFIAP